jgi:hypothetical protein
MNRISIVTPFFTPNRFIPSVYSFIYILPGGALEWCGERRHGRVHEIDGCENFSGNTVSRQRYTISLRRLMSIGVYEAERVVEAILILIQAMRFRDLRIEGRVVRGDGCEQFRRPPRELIRRGETPHSV